MAHFSEQSLQFCLQLSLKVTLNKKFSGGLASFLHPDSSPFPINWNHRVFSDPLFFFFFFFSSVFFEQPLLHRMGQTGKRSFGSGDNGVTDDNPVLQNPLTNTKSCTAEQRSTPPLLMLLCLQHGLLNLIFNKLSKNGLLSTNFRLLSQFLHLTGKRPFHKFQEESSSDFSQL